MCNLFIFGILTNINNVLSLLYIGARASCPNPLPMSYWLHLSYLSHCDIISHWDSLLFEVLTMAVFFFLFSISLGCHQTASIIQKMTGRALPFFIHNLRQEALTYRIIISLMRVCLSSKQCCSNSPNLL